MNITEEQKLALIDSLFTYMKYMKNNEIFRNCTTEQILNRWIKYVKKEEWMVERIKNDINFLARLHELVDIYSRYIGDFDIKECEIEPENPNKEALAFLEDLAKLKGEEVGLKEPEKYNRKKVLKRIDELFGRER